MLSSDKNVETIAELIELLKRYVGLQKEFLELHVIEKVVRLVTALTLTIVMFILAVSVLFYLSFAIIYWMAPTLTLAGAFALVALFFFVLLLLAIVFRKPWIERPLVRFLARTLLN